VNNVSADRDHVVAWSGPDRNAMKSCRPFQAVRLTDDVPLSWAPAGPGRSRWAAGYHSTLPVPSLPWDFAVIDTPVSLQASSSSRTRWKVDVAAAAKAACHDNLKRSGLSRARPTSPCLRMPRQPIAVPSARIPRVEHSFPSGTKSHSGVRPPGLSNPYDSIRTTSAARQ